MKKIISIILVLSLLAVLSVNAFAEREIVSFETLFESQLPTYLFDVTEFEAGGEYVVYVSKSFMKSLSSVSYFLSNKSSNVSCFINSNSELSAILKLGDISIS